LELFWYIERVHFLNKIALAGNRGGRPTWRTQFSCLENRLIISIIPIAVIAKNMSIYCLVKERNKNKLVCLVNFISSAYKNKIFHRLIFVTAASEMRDSLWFPERAARRRLCSFGFGTRFHSQLLEAPCSADDVVTWVAAHESLFDHRKRYRELPISGSENIYGGQYRSCLRLWASFGNQNLFFLT
jgi:hypothetical protein